MISYLTANPFGRANLLVSRHVYIFEDDPVWEGEPPGEPARFYLRRTIRIRIDILLTIIYYISIYN